MSTTTHKMLGSPTGNPEAARMFMVVVTVSRSLEIMFTFTGNGGSNPSLSANKSFSPN